MDQKFIPDDIAQFVIEKIDSVAELEALLLLRGEPERRWTPQELSRRLYLSDKDGQDILTALSSKGLVLYTSNASEAYEYAPASCELRQMVDRLCAIYSKQIVSITNLIHSKARKRVQEFAEAFKLRKNKDG